LFGRPDENVCNATIGARIVNGRGDPAGLDRWLTGQVGWVTDEDIESLAAEAYLYGFPLVFYLDHVSRYVTTGVGSNPQAPFNGSVMRGRWRHGGCGATNLR
jgi:hypothetical protein